MLVERSGLQEVEALGPSETVVVVGVVASGLARESLNVEVAVTRGEYSDCVACGMLGVLQIQALNIVPFQDWLLVWQC